MASVPFARGSVADIPELHVAGVPTVWQSFGARWDDGSVRQALCMFRQRIDAESELHVPLVAGKGPALPEEWKLGLGRHKVRFVVEYDGATTRVEPEIVELLESNAARVVVLMRARIGDTGLVGEVTLEAYVDQPHAYCGVAVFFSDPTTPDMQRHYTSIAVETEGLALVLRHANPLGMSFERTDSGSRVTLLRDAVLGDGQGLRRNGALVPTTQSSESIVNQSILAAAMIRPLAATDWRASGAFGVFGYVPEPPPWLAGAHLRAAFRDRHLRFVQQSLAATGDPFRVGAHGLSKRPSQTGDQADFGIVQLEPVAYSGIPSFLHEVELSVMQEGCRPVHFFETDASPVRVENHPGWCVWEGRTHYSGESSRVRLGKPHMQPKFESHMWLGKRRSHWSANYLCAYYLLTGCPQALLEIRNEIRLFLAAETVDPKLVTSGAGPARAVGRTLHTASWLYLCTGDQDLLRRMLDRVHKVAIPAWHGRELSAQQVRAFKIDQPVGNAFDGKSPYWAAWMDTLLVPGPAAVYLLTGDTSSKAFTDDIAINALEHAFRLDEQGNASIVYSMRWLDGEPVPTDKLWDPNFVKLSGSLAVWGMPAIDWARQVARERDRPDLVEYADRLLSALRARRAKPSDGWFDRMGQWDALRRAGS